MSVVKSKKISSIVEHIVPEFVRDNHSGFITFIQKYFEYLERDLGEYDTIAYLTSYADIDDTVDTFLPQFRKTYAGNIPESLAVDLKHLVKQIRRFYLTKGTEASYEFLFRSVFNTWVDFYYPKVDILRCSDGKWVVPYFLVATDNTIEDLTPFVDKKINGATSNATAYVETTQIVEWPLTSGLTELALSLVDVAGDFLNGEVISIVENGPETLIIEAAAGVQVSNGRWIGRDGWLSSDKFLQDNYFYQDYSYVLRSDISIDYYKKIIEENVHPAGMKFFGEVIFQDPKVDYFDNIISNIFWIISWIAENVQIIVTEVDKRFILEYKTSHNNTLPRDIEWSYYEKNREDRHFLTSKFRTIEYWEAHTMDEFEIHRPERNVIVSVDGVKLLPITDYGIDHLNIAFTTAPTNDPLKNIDIHFLPSMEYEPEYFIGTGFTNDFTIARSISDDHGILVYVEGVKLKPGYDYYVVGTTMTIVSAPSLADDIEVIYLASYGQSPEYLSGDGTTQSFSLTKYPKRYRDHNVIVSVDGLKKIPFVHYRINNDGTLFFLSTDIPANGTNNIEIVYLGETRLETEAFSGDGVATGFVMEKVIDVFPFSPESYLNIV